MKMSGLVLAFLLLSGTASANQWVYGKITAVEEYTAYEPDQGILITLVQRNWPWTSDDNNLNSICSGRFRLTTTAEGVTEATKNRIYSALLAAYVSGRTARLYVNEATANNAHECAIKIGGLAG